MTRILLSLLPLIAMLGMAVEARAACGDYLSVTGSRAHSATMADESATSPETAHSTADREPAWPDCPCDGLQCRSNRQPASPPVPPAEPPPTASDALIDGSVSGAAMHASMLRRPSLVLPGEPLAGRLERPPRCF